MSAALPSRLCHRSSKKRHDDLRHGIALAHEEARRVARVCDYFVANGLVKLPANISTRRRA